MRHLRAVAVVVGLTAVVPWFAHAAELTRVASSFDEGHPFGLFVDLGFDRSQRLVSILHEVHTGPPDNFLAVRPELRYASADYRLNLDLHAGLWHAYEDHRMATAGAIVGLSVVGMEVDDIATTAKTLPDFPAMWARMLGGDR